MELNVDSKSESKVCSKCQQNKPLDEYGKSARGRLGRKSCCKKCAAALAHDYLLHKKAAKKEQTIGRGSQVVGKILAKVNGLPPGRGESAQNGRAQALAEEHWSYVRSLLVAHGDDEDSSVLNQIEFHYKSAMIHGYKHGVSDRERAVQS